MSFAMSINRTNCTGKSVNLYLELETRDEEAGPYGVLLSGAINDDFALHKSGADPMLWIYDSTTTADAIGLATALVEEEPQKGGSDYVQDSAPVLVQFTITRIDTTTARVVGSITYGYHKPSCYLKFTSTDVPSLNNTTYTDKVSGTGAFDFVVSVPAGTGVVKCKAYSPFDLASNEIQDTVFA